MAERHLAGCNWFWAWAVIGIGAALAAVSLGVLLLVPVLIAAGALARRPQARASAYGVVSGVGLLLVFIAYVQRNGPGNGELNPLPWLVAGLVCLVAGIAGHALRSARRDA